MEGTQRIIKFQLPCHRQATNLQKPASTNLHYFRKLLQPRHVGSFSAARSFMAKWHRTAVTALLCSLDDGADRSSGQLYIHPEMQHAEADERLVCVWLFHSRHFLYQEWRRGRVLKKKPSWKTACLTSRRNHCKWNQGQNGSAEDWRCSSPADTSREDSSVQKST